MKSLAVILPSQDHMPVDSALCLAKMVFSLGREPNILFSGVINPKGSCVAEQRNRAVHDLLPREITHYLWMDSDMVFTPTLYRELIKADKAIVGTDAVTRRTPIRRVTQGLDEEGDDVQEVESIGFGLVLTKAEVFKDVSYPWFWPQFKPVYLGEDRYFCKKAKEKGYKIHCYNKEGVGHLGQYDYRREDLI